MNAPIATGTLDERIAACAARDLPLAVRILREAIRIPADYVDKSPEQGGDPLCGLSNHEGPRLEYLRRTMLETGARYLPVLEDGKLIGVISFRDVAKAVLL